MAISETNLANDALPPGVNLSADLLQFGETSIAAKAVSAASLETTLKPPGPLLFPIVMCGMAVWAFSDLGTGWGVAVSAVGATATLFVYANAPRLTKLVLNVSGSKQTVYESTDPAQVQRLKERVEALTVSPPVAKA